MNYIDTWHVSGTMADGNILTCYGLKTEAAALEVGARIMPLCVRVELTHTTKATTRARWQRAIFTMRSEGTIRSR